MGCAAGISSHGAKSVGGSQAASSWARPTEDENDTAIRNVEKALELEPDNAGAKTQLRRLKKPS